MDTASPAAETASRRMTDVFVSRARRKRRILWFFSLPLFRRQGAKGENRTARRVETGVAFVSFSRRARYTLFRIVSLAFSPERLGAPRSGGPPVPPRCGTPPRSFDRSPVSALG